MIRAPFPDVRVATIDPDDLGADAIGSIERRLQCLTDEVAAWRAVGEATAIDDRAGGGGSA